MPIARIGIRPNLEVEITGETLDILKELAFWDGLPSLCPPCLKEGAESQLVFTLRTPTARQGSRAGESFVYYGMECTGKPSHEVQFSQRKADKGGGLFIRLPNRKDGKPNWRLAYSASHDDDEEDEGQHGPSSDTVQINELLAMGREKGYKTEAELNVNCRHVYNKEIRQLTRPEAIDYYKTLRAI